MVSGRGVMSRLLLSSTLALLLFWTTWMGSELSNDPMAVAADGRGISVGLCRAVAKKLETTGAQEFLLQPTATGPATSRYAAGALPSGDRFDLLIDQVLFEGEKYNIYLKKAEAAETMILFEYLKQVEVLRIEGHIVLVIRQAKSKYRSGSYDLILLDGEKVVNCGTSQVKGF